MILILGIAFICSTSIRDCTLLFEQLRGLYNTVAAYCGFIPAGSYGPPTLLTHSMSIYWSSVQWYGVQTSELLILTTTPLFLLMLLRGPNRRPPIRDLLSQPGTVAGLAIAVGFILVTGWIHRLSLGLDTKTVTPVAIGGTVSLAWIFLALTRKWRNEKAGSTGWVECLVHPRSRSA